MPGQGTVATVLVGGRRWPTIWVGGAEASRSPRPIGRLEKSWLWARRNPSITTASGLAAAALVAAVIVSSVAAIQANVLAKAERQRKEDAIAARDSVEWALARS